MCAAAPRVGVSNGRRQFSEDRTIIQLIAHRSRARAHRAMPIIKTIPLWAIWFSFKARAASNYSNQRLCV